MKLSSIDRKLLNLMQAEFPLTGEPYADLGQRLGINAEDVIRHIEQLKAKEVIRSIGPVLDPASLGYQTTLVAMRVAETNLEKAERNIIGHSGVSHGYERDHYFNVWFTLAVPPSASMDTELERLTQAADAEAVLSLPAIKVFKIGVYFDLDEDDQSTLAISRLRVPASQAELSDTERSVINQLQQDLPLTPMPFNAIAEQAGMNVQPFLARCQLLQQRGIIRRFSASINHNHAGFAANAMACWIAPPDKVDAAGYKLASFKQVSHCYQRKTSPLWRYNIFAVIHGRSKEICQEIADRASHETRLTSYVLLYSTKEFKKTRVRYPV